MVNPNTSAVSRVWIVRGGQDGAGPTLFCVYAPDMHEARDQTTRTLLQLASQRRFTVHALAAGEKLPEGASLEEAPLASLTPALDLAESIASHNPDGCAFCVAFDAQFRSLVS